MMQNNNPMAMIQQFMQFKNSFQGDPKAEVMKLLQSGRLNQQQLNQLQSTASSFRHMLGMFNHK